MPQNFEKNWENNPTQPNPFLPQTECIPHARSFCTQVLSLFLVETIFFTTDFIGTLVSIHAYQACESTCLYISYFREQVAKL